MQETTRVRALCCECGNLRTTSARWSRRGDNGFSYEDPDDPRGWRMTRTLKCSVCKTQTVHALLRDDKTPHIRDLAERQDHMPPPASARRRTVDDELRREVLRRIEDITNEVGLEDLTLEESLDLFEVLNPVLRRMRGSR